MDNDDRGVGAARTVGAGPSPRSGVTMKKTILILALALTGCGSGDDAATTSGLPRGVTADTITIGSHTDLSGGLAVWGVAMINGIRMRFEDVNAAGGIHGRKIEFVVEDNQYQVPMAVKATNKLINVDKIFLCFIFLYRNYE